MSLCWWAQNQNTDCCSVTKSDSLQPLGLQQSRLPCPWLSPGVCSNSCPLTQWCCPTISSSVIPFSSCLLSFPVWGSFFNKLALLIKWLKHWRYSISICPLKEHPRLISFRIDWLISLLSEGLSRAFFSTTIQKHHMKSITVWKGKALMDTFQQSWVCALPSWSLYTFLSIQKVSNDIIERHMLNREPYLLLVIFWDLLW